MKKVFTIFLILLFILPVITIIFSGTTINSEAAKKADEYFNQEVIETEPHTKEDGSPYQICYVDIDPYPASGEMLYYVLKQLYDRGWMEIPGISAFSEVPFDAADLDAKELINYLADKGTGDYISFSRQQNYYIALEDEKDVKKGILDGVKNGDIDLILALGTSPGILTIKTLGITEVPIMVYFCVDPVSSDLSETQEYSGQDNVWCHTSSEIYKNQLSFYHDAYKFTNVGMVYYSGSVAAINTYREAAQSLGVRISETMIATLESPDQEEAYYKKLKKSYEDLVENRGIDAFVLNTDMIKDVKRMPDMLSVFYENNIPVFVQNGEFLVSHDDGGVMLMSASDAVSQAPFAVDAMIRIFGGEKPGEIYEKFVPSPYVSINLENAEKMNMDIPDEIIRMSEKFY